MQNPKHLLLVEGTTDKSFFTQFCQENNFTASVTIAAPREIGGQYNSKQGAINHLKTLLAQLADGQLERIGLILDSDHNSDGGGFCKTVTQVAKHLLAFGFNPEPTPLPHGGLIFPHSDGLADFGLWVMPNNQDEGILEDWLLSSITADEQPLLQHAKSTVASLKPPKFRALQTSKAEIATWLAWQDKPGEGLYYAIKGNLLDPQTSHYVGLKEWLTHVYS